MDSNDKSYNYISSFGRIDDILALSQANYEEVKELPDRDRLTYTNGFYAYCTATATSTRASSWRRLAPTQPGKRLRPPTEPGSRLTIRQDLSDETYSSRTARAVATLTAESPITVCNPSPSSRATSVSAVEPGSTARNSPDPIPSATISANVDRHSAYRSECSAARSGTWEARAQYSIQRRQLCSAFFFDGKVASMRLIRRSLALGKPRADSIAELV